MGYIIETLNQTQMADNTIILFHADHGYHLGECAPNHLRCRGALWMQAESLSPVRTVAILGEMRPSGLRPVHSPHETLVPGAPG